jgi:hypothetical protein
MTLTDEQRRLFWSRVDKGPALACWPWRGTVLRNGYGQAKFSGKKHLAHRLALALAGQEVPAGMLVLHAPLVCHNRLCCNPAHLRLGTAADNARDRVSDGTASYLRPGKHAPNSKLGVAGAGLARFLVEQGSTHATVAEWLLVSRTTVSLACEGRTWLAA